MDVAYIQYETTSGNTSDTLAYILFIKRERNQLRELELSDSKPCRLTLIALVTNNISIAPGD